ncbi:MAG TPA: hypothetical protein VF774_28155 [Pseudoduganella sp.]|jgi:hypothetical protein
MSSEPTTPFKGTAVTAVPEVDDTISDGAGAGTPSPAASAATGTDAIGRDEPGSPTPAVQPVTGLKAAEPGGPTGAAAALRQAYEGGKRPPR